MRIRTLTVLTLTAVLAANVHDHNNHVEAAPLPVSHQNVSANAPHKVKLQQVTPEILEQKKEKNNKKVSRSKNRQAIVKPNISSVQSYANSYMLQQYGWGQDQFECLVNLWNRESGWRYNAKNSGSGAYGIPQSLPGSKMASAGADWRTNPETQIRWGLSYIQKRYDTPCGAWGSFTKKGWY